MGTLDRQLTAKRDTMNAIPDGIKYWTNEEVQREIDRCAAALPVAEDRKDYPRVESLEKRMFVMKEVLRLRRL